MQTWPTNTNVFKVLASAAISMYTPNMDPIIYKNTKHCKKIFFRKFKFNDIF